MSAPMLFIVTDHADKAVRGLLGLSLNAAPAWLAVVSTPEGLLTIPAGAAVKSIWHSDGSLVETLWREARRLREYNLDHAAHDEKITNWLRRLDAHRAAEDARLIVEYCVERGEPVPASLNPEAKASVEQRCDNPMTRAAGREMRVGEAGRGSQPATSEGGRDSVERHVPSPVPQKRAARWS